MSSYFERFREGSASKGGIIGAILGALVSTRTHNPADSTLKKAGKTGIFTALGYLLGDLLQKRISKRSNSQN